MDSVTPLVSILTRAVNSVLCAERVTDHTHAGKDRSKKRVGIKQSVCIEVAVALTLNIYIGWVCISGLYFDKPIITSDNMIMGSVLVLFAVLGAKLLWVVLSLLQSR